MERQFLQMMNAAADHTMSSSAFSCPQSPDLVAVGKKRVAHQKNNHTGRVEEDQMHPSQKRKINAKSEANKLFKL